MSDPVTNDYASLLTLTEAQNRIAVFETVLRCNRMGISHSETREYLAMLGIAETAYEVRGRAKPASPVPFIPRDSYGRARSSEPQEAVRLCGAGLHNLLGPDGRRRSDTGNLYCATCQAARLANPPGPSDLPEGHRWCTCVPEKHLLTPFTSETTYVQPNGKRRCRAARRKAQQERQKTAKRGRAA